MKRILIQLNIVLILSILIFTIGASSCKKTENPIKFNSGTFPDSVINLADINSEYADYNSSITQINGYTSLVFSSNRATSGGKFDFVQALISFNFDKTNGSFSIGTGILEDIFIETLLFKANTPGDDLGPFRLFNKTDGNEYFIYSSDDGLNNQDLYYMKNLPLFGTDFTDIYGPYPVKLLNTSYNDGYLCFNSNQDTAYFSSDINGSFDIYYHQKPEGSNISNWFNLNYSESAMVDGINSDGNDKCPFIQKNLMLFASDREGGLGGYDLYYSIYKDGIWSDPINLGPDVNTEFNEYRPIIGSQPDFTNLFMIFSSDRPGGKGSYDLYFKGFNRPE